MEDKTVVEPVVVETLGVDDVKKTVLDTILSVFKKEEEPAAEPQPQPAAAEPTLEEIVEARVNERLADILPKAKKAKEQELEKKEKDLINKEHEKLVLPSLLEDAKILADAKGITLEEFVNTNPAYQANVVPSSSSVGAAATSATGPSNAADAERWAHLKQYR